MRMRLLLWITLPSLNQVTEAIGLFLVKQRSINRPCALAVTSRRPTATGARAINPHTHKQSIN